LEVSIEGKEKESEEERDGAGVATVVPATKAEVRKKTGHRLEVQSNTSCPTINDIK